MAGFFNLKIVIKKLKNVLTDFINCNRIDSHDTYGHNKVAKYRKEMVV